MACGPLNMQLDHTAISTLGQLKQAGYKPRSIKDELRANLVAALKDKRPVFNGIYGYEDSVMPELERAILSKHNIILLGLRGQAKTRLARLMVNLLDEWVPVVAGSELNDDPLQPLSRFAHDLIAEHGDETPVAWLHRNDRYTEKLATPDVSVADLIGDADPIKAANMRLPYSDERVIHFGLIPRAHRGLFVINELPDLQARIQVALFNILQEGDIQIRGFKVRLPLDIQFVFTANPEDYTNRGSIVTPLKDRIDSQIITHYPGNIQIGRLITSQEADVKDGQQRIYCPELAKDLIEQIAVEARTSEYVDAKSGVSARLTISAYENLLSAVERRMLVNDEKQGYVRVNDLYGVVPSITGKIELVYEGEQEGAQIVAQNLVGKAIRSFFVQHFPDPEKAKKQKSGIYKTITSWFGDGNHLQLLADATHEEYKQALMAVPGLYDLIDGRLEGATEEYKLFMMEFALHGLAEYSVISKSRMGNALDFKDLLSSMLNMGGSKAAADDDDDDDEPRPRGRR